MESSSLEDRTNDEDNASQEDWHFAAILVGHKSGDDGPDQSAARGKRGNKLLIGGREFMAERFADRDQHRGDVASVVS